MSEKLINEILKKSFGGKPEEGVFFLVPTKSGKEKVFSMLSYEMTAKTESMHKDLWDKKVLPFLIKEFGIDKSEDFEELKENAEESYIYPIARGVVDLVRDLSSPSERIERIIVVLPEHKYKDKVSTILMHFNLLDLQNMAEIEVLPGFAAYPKQQKIFKNILEEKPQPIKKEDLQPYYTKPMQNLPQFANKIIDEIIKESFIGKPKEGVFFFVPTKTGKEILFTLNNEDMELGSMSMHQDLWEGKVLPFLIKEFSIDEKDRNFNEMRAMAQQDYHYPITRGAVFFDLNQDWTAHVPNKIFLEMPKNKRNMSDEIISRFSLYDLKDKIDLGFEQTEFEAFPPSKLLFEKVIEKELEPA